MDTSVPFSVACSVDMSVDMHEVDPVVGNFLLNQDGNPIIDQDNSQIEGQG